MCLTQKTYFDRFTKDLGSVIGSETGGHFEQLLLNSLQGMEEEYDESKYAERMKDDIKKLQNMGLGKMGCDENKIFRFLCESPPQYLHKINIGFAEEYGETLGKALEKE